MSAGDAGRLSVDWFAVQQAELTMSKGKKAPHLTAVGDRGGAEPDLRSVDQTRHSVAELERYATEHDVDRIADLVGEAADNTLTYAEAAATKGGT
jgi:hypothetical protein